MAGIISTPKQKLDALGNPIDPTIQDPNSPDVDQNASSTIGAQTGSSPLNNTAQTVQSPSPTVTPDVTQAGRVDVNNAGTTTTTKTPTPIGTPAPSTTPTPTPAATPSWTQKTYTSAGGQQFKVNDQGIRLNADGSIFQGTGGQQRLDANGNVYHGDAMDGTYDASGNIQYKPTPTPGPYDPGSGLTAPSTTTPYSVDSANAGQGQQSLLWNQMSAAQQDQVRSQLATKTSAQQVQYAQQSQTKGANGQTVNMTGSDNPNLTTSQKAEWAAYQAGTGPAPVPIDPTTGRPVSPAEYDAMHQGEAAAVRSYPISMSGVQGQKWDASNAINGGGFAGWQAQQAKLGASGSSGDAANPGSGGNQNASPDASNPQARQANPKTGYVARPVDPNANPTAANFTESGGSANYDPSQPPSYYNRPDPNTPEGAAILSKMPASQLTWDPSNTNDPDPVGQAEWNAKYGNWHSWSPTEKDSSGNPVPAPPLVTDTSVGKAQNYLQFTPTPGYVDPKTPSSWLGASGTPTDPTTSPGAPNGTPTPSATPTGTPTGSPPGAPSASPTGSPTGAPSPSGSPTGSPTGSPSATPAPTGIISGAGQTANGAYTYDPTLLGPASQENLTPDQTVEGRVQSLMSSDNPLIQQARTQAMEQMAARGLSNSSMAQTASDQAAYSVAIQIAQSDAAAEQSASQFNATANNQFALTNNNSQNAAAGFGATASNTLAGQNIASNTSKYGVDAQSYTAAQNLLGQIGMNNANISSQQLMQVKDLLSRQGINTDNLNSQQAIAALQAQTSLNTAFMQQNTSLGTAGINQQTSLAQIAGNTSQNNASLTGSSRNQYNVNLSNLITNTNTEIHSINTNANMSPTEKQSAIDAVNSRAQNQAHALWVSAQLPGDENQYIFVSPTTPTGLENAATPNVSGAYPSTGIISTPSESNIGKV